MDLDDTERPTTAALSIGILFGIAVNVLAVYGIVALLSG
jgi:hypothetical protein